MDGRPIHYAARRQRSSNVGHDVYIINILIDDGTPSTGQIITYKMYILVKRHRHTNVYTVNTLLYFTIATIAFPVIKPYLQQLYSEDMSV